MAENLVIVRAISELLEQPRNPRTHSNKQIEQIARSIQRFGFTNPILVDAHGRIIAGHGRVAAAKLLGMTEVPTICIAGWSEEEIRAYVIADNKLAESAGWDRGLLALEFKDLADLDVDFDLTLTGFELPEIDCLIAEASLGNEAEDPADVIPQVEAGSAITRPGDIWEIAGHRLICGDATAAQTYAELLGTQKAGMVFADPPYNLVVNGHVSGSGQIKHREFAMASGEMSAAEFTNFLATVFRHLAAFSVDGCIHFQCMDWRHLNEILAAGAETYTELKNLCVWAKNSGGMGSLYRSAHELVFVFKSGKAPHINNIELGKHGRYRTNVWIHPGANSFGPTRDQDLAMHPTVKPVGMVMDAILDCSKRKEIVLDPFAGSGTTLVAAQRTGRRGFGIEIDPLYCDLIVRRMQDLLKIDAILAGNGRTFGEIADMRTATTGPEHAA